jgi:hypothetical protein
MLQPIVETRPPSDSGQYGYPAEALVLELKNGNYRVHLIFGAAADTMTSAGLDSAYANAPNGSIYVCMDGNTTKKIAIKFGNVGLTDGSFLFSNAAYATAS